MKKRIFALTLAFALILGMGTVALANTTGTGTIGFTSETVIIIPPNDPRVPTAWGINPNLNLNFGTAHFANTASTVTYSSLAVDATIPDGDRLAGFAMINNAPVTVRLTLGAFSGSALSGASLVLDNERYFRATDLTDVTTVANSVQDTALRGPSGSAVAGSGTAVTVFQAPQSGLHAGNWSGALTVPPGATQTGTPVATMTWSAVDGII